jgi:hypothetical protein
MDKYIIDKRTGLTYELVGDYYLIAGDDESEIEIGVWGQRHANYLRQHCRGTYTAMILNGTLNSYLQELDNQAEEMFVRLVSQLAEREGITERMKAENSLEWVRRMNGIRERVTEIVNRELIYV